jgi:hypothetical protein
MGLLATIELVVGLLNGVYATVSKNPDPLAALIAGIVKGTLDQLALVQNTPVMKDQLEKMRITPTW